MNLTKLRIINFRGIQDVDFLVSDFTTIIGQNNAGKSSVLRAIDILCNNGTPEFEEILNKSHGVKMEIIGTFENIQDWERDTPGVASLISDNKIILRVSAHYFNEGGKDKVEKGLHAYVRKEIITGWSDTWADVSQEIKDLAGSLSITNGTHFKTKANNERVKQAIRENRPELIVHGDLEWTDEGISIPAALKQAVPSTILIPAVRDAAEEMKTGKTSKTAFGELINSLILPKVKELAAYNTIIEALGQLGEQIQNPAALPTIQEINEKISNRLKGLIDVQSKLTMSNPDIDAALISNVGIRIVDGQHDTPISLQGHGLQRTLIFTLLELIAERNSENEENDNVKNTIILFEEPELYMHPQMIRKLKSLLLRVSKSNHWQVICTTHNPVLIDVADNPRSLVILKKDQHTKLVSKSQLPENIFDDTADDQIQKAALRAALDFHPTVCEAFFTDSCILVEGDTEMALLKHCPQLLATIGIPEQKIIDTSIVSCGGKWTIPAIARILQKFEIPFKVVHDMDRKGLTDEELAAKKPIHPYKANAKIAAHVSPENLLVNEDTVEHLWRGKGSSGKPYNAIVAINEILEAGQLEDFPKLKDFINFCYS